MFNVFLNNKFSLLVCIQFGVPQGSNIGPLFFNTVCMLMNCPPFLYRSNLYSMLMILDSL